MTQRCMEEAGVSPLEARDRLIANTAEWLGRGTTLLRSIGELFPYTSLDHNNLTDGTATTHRMVTLPRIVLPAEPLTSFMGTTPVTRRSATRLTAYYAYPESETKGITRNLELANLPTPDRIHLGCPHPIGIPLDIQQEPTSRYRYNDTVTISGERPQLLSWYANILGISLPYMPTGRSDELHNFDVFRDVPPEVLEQRPDVLAFHAQNLDRFIDGLAKITLAVHDPSLNPR